MIRKNLKLLVLLFIGILVAVFIFKPTTLVKHSKGIDSVSKLEMFIGQSLPTGTKDVNFAEEGAIDTIVFLKFSTDPIAAKKFLNEIGFENFDDPLDPEAMISPNGNYSWWNVSDFSQIYGGNFSTPTKGYDLMLVKQSEDLWTVFLAVFEV